MKVLIGIQARSGSTRLPGKVYEKIGEKSVLEWVHHWCMESQKEVKSKAVQSFVAVVGPSKDAKLEEYCHDRDWAYFSGDEYDLFDRYFRALEYSQADGLVRITGDCWNIRPKNIAKCVENLVHVDYTSNTIQRSFREAQDVQGASKSGFEWIDQNTNINREHPFFEFDMNLKMRRKFAKKGFKLKQIIDPYNPIFYHHSIDTLEDLERARSEYERIRRTIVAR